MINLFRHFHYNLLLQIFRGILIFLNVDKILHYFYLKTVHMF